MKTPLISIPKFGTGVGLHRLAWACAPLYAAGWLAGLDAIRVTGSNGKGSVSAMTAAVLQALGVSCGLYTSPHLYEFNERIVLNGQPISDADLADATAWFQERQQEYARLHPEDHFGAFEAFTAVALYYYSQQAPQALVAEAGIGGRYDSTRLIPGRLVGLASVDLEHTQLLGSTLELIAYDKADLCPPGGTLVAGDLEADLLRRLESYCALRGVELVSSAAVARVERVGFAGGSMQLDLQVDGLAFPGLEVSLQGYHQVNNAILAILLARRWQQAHLPGVAEARFKAAVYAGLAGVLWPGRFEQVNVDPPVYIDVGHTPAAIDLLVRSARAVLGEQPVLLVTGVSKDKEVERIVARLLPLASGVVCTRAYHKGSPVEAIRAVVGQHAPHLPAFSYPTIDAAMGFAVDYARERGMVVLVAGGLFLAIEARQALVGEDPQELAFF